MNPENLTIKQIVAGLKRKTFSAVELAEAYLKRVRQEDKKLHAFLTVTEALALSQARKLDKKIASREKIGALAGVPIAVKDNILVDGIKATAGSKILASYTAPYDATVVKRLKKADVVIVGKTNLDEFALGSSTENSAFGPTRNPYDLERVPGGSSGGSAAAVAAGGCVCALGSDTGGSIRQPAAFCGLVGLRPTYGRVSRSGLIASASSLDQIGPLAKNADDAKRVLEVIEGRDEMDSTSLDLSGVDERGKLEFKGLTIGVVKEHFASGLDAEVKQVVEQAIARCKDAGAKITEVSLPHSQYSLAAYYIIQPAEVSANLARYDGIKYGCTAPSKELLASYLQTRQTGFGDEVKRRIILGTYTLSAGYYDAYYNKALKVQALIQEDFKKAFGKADMLMGPMTPSPPFKLGEKASDPVAMYWSDIYAVPASLAGLPAVSAPCGRVNGLPVGLHVIGPHLRDKKILQAAALIQTNG